MVDTSELLRVFGPFEQPKGEHHSGQVSEQRDTASADQSEQVIRHLKQEIEHLTPYFVEDSHIDSLKQAMLLLTKITEAKLTGIPDAMVEILEKILAPSCFSFLSGHPGVLNQTFPKIRQISERSSPLKMPPTQN